ncbi:hypothetical protein Gorai_018241 [Gossypium raimondii]|uniref:Uncharacterized protein n=1 Tax=Gossypium raimondii TaxID=29730 RepID=A0A7J8PK62_GOSRA|nr:hypothetical protein [Gossypium raimondii]
MSGIITGISQMSISLILLAHC